MAHFDIKNLTFSYPESDRKILDEVTLSIEKGEFVTICGKSGSGKTTLLRHLKSPLTPVGHLKGEVLFRDIPLSAWDQRSQAGQIGYVMQNPDNQIVTDKVWHELAFGLESLGMDPRNMRLRVAEMANYFGIQNWFHKKVSELSGGEKQLLNLASIMAMQPEVLILDEPTSQLDPIAAMDFLDTVRKINQDLGTTVIMTEHRLEQLFTCSDRIFVMDQGKIIACDRPREVGEAIKALNHEMFSAFPTPMQIYYGVAEGGKCPLTVREGRNWLSERFPLEEVKTAELPEPPQDLDEEDYALSLEEVWFRYEKNAPDILQGVNLKVPRKSLFAVMGGNGSGKTTMLKALSGISRPYGGKVIIDGKWIEKYKGTELYQGHIAMLPQDPQMLFVRKTVKEDLLEMLPSKMDMGEKLEKIASLSEKTEISHLLEAHPYDLSGGEQQRAALCKVLLSDPKILLLDEPTKGIDAFFKIKLASILRKLTADGVTVVMVSHDVEFCASYADQVALFFDGQILTTNTPQKFFASNTFYTTAANRMSRHVFQNAITAEDVVKLWKMNASC